MPAVGEGVAVPAADDSVPVLPATRGPVKGLRGRALDALAGDGGVGRDRNLIAPGSVAFGERGYLCVRARSSHSGYVGVLGADDDFPSRISLGVAVDTWRSARASVVQSMSSSGSASLDQLASAGSSLLHQCHGSVAAFTAAIGSSCLAPHIHCDTVRHWFGVAKNFHAISLFLRVLSPGSPVCVVRRGDLPSELAYGNHPSVASHYAIVHDKVCTDAIHGRVLVFG